MKKHHDLGEGITHATIDILNIIEAPDSLRARFERPADGLAAKELTVADLTESERQAFDKSRKAVQS